MTDYPDFSTNNYQVISELGRNNLGGRVTYLAEQTTTKQQVVIKQFQFALRGASWAEYDAYEREIAMLQHLNHPGIPKYLDSFQTADGFCMVQEYINAQSLAVSRSWIPQEIKRVAVAILEILVYLQSLNPSVIHRDIKPENILADENLNIYLVDFGFARLGGVEIAASSVVKGTMGFMPPEQLFNRELTTASDLYGLGATLICLLTGTPSGKLGNLIDENYQIKFQHLVPPLKQGLISWLEKISQPNSKQRYANAVEALKVLKSLDVDRLPKVRVSKNQLEIFGKEFGEKVTETITISNPIPDTMLSGRWEVAPHPSDPPHTPYDHSWIEFDFYQFEGNEIECKITVDTRKLLAEESYQRELLLHSNSEGESLKIPIITKTSPLPKEKSKYLFLIIGAVTSPVLIFFWPYILIGLILEKRRLSGFVVSSLASLPLNFWALELIIASGDYYGFMEEFSSMRLLYLVIHCLVFAEIVAAMLARLNSNQRKRCYVYLIIIFAIWLIVSVPSVAIVGTITGIFFWIALSLPAFIAAESIKGLSKLKGKEGFKFILFSCGLGMSGVLAYRLISKAFNLVNPEGLTIAEQILVVIVAIAPVLLFAFWLVKTIVKSWRAIARYNREKPNLIKP